MPINLPTTLGMERISATDAGFFHAEGTNTPMHVGSVSVFDGPNPSYGDVVRLLLGKLPRVPRFRQRVLTVPFDLGRPLWVDDDHFQILYRVRHTAVPRPGGPEQLRNLAGPIAAGLRVSIGIYSYVGAITFGINADFDAFPDVHVLADGIGRGMEELLGVAGAPGGPDADAAGLATQRRRTATSPRAVRRRAA